MGVPVPHPLLDHIMQTYNVKNDAALARLLEVTPPDISRIRNGRRPISAKFILTIHDATGWPVKDIKALL